MDFSFFRRAKSYQFNKFSVSQKKKNVNRVVYNPKKTTTKP